MLTFWHAVTARSMTDLGIETRGQAYHISRGIWPLTSDLDSSVQTLAPDNTESPCCANSASKSDNMADGILASFLWNWRAWHHTVTVVDSEKSKSSVIRTHHLTSAPYATTEPDRTQQDCQEYHITPYLPVECRTGWKGMETMIKLIQGEASVWSIHVPLFNI